MHLSCLEMRREWIRGSQTAKLCMCAMVGLASMRSMRGGFIFCKASFSLLSFLEKWGSARGWMKVATLESFIVHVNVSSSSRRRRKKLVKQVRLLKGLGSARLHNLSWRSWSRSWCRSRSRSRCRRRCARNMLYQRSWRWDCNRRLTYVEQIKEFVFVLLGQWRKRFT